MNKLSEEPVAVGNTIIGILQAAGVALMAFGIVDWDDTQQQALLGVLVLVAPILGSLVIRRFTKPTTQDGQERTR